MVALGVRVLSQVDAIEKMALGSYMFKKQPKVSALPSGTEFHTDHCVRYV